MVLKLYGYHQSAFTLLAALVCREKEVPYEFVSVDLFKGEHKAPEYLKYQPFGEVPYIDDGGFLIYESRAIARYLIKKYPNQGTPGLIPTDLEGEALFEQASSVEVSHYGNQIGPLVFNFSSRLLLGEQTNQAKVDEHLKNLEAKLDVYEIILGKQKYLAGDKVTLADLQHLPFGPALPLVGLGYLFEKRPNVARWWSDIYNRPAWQAVKDGP